MKKIYLIIVFLVTVSFRLHAQGVIDFDSGYMVRTGDFSSQVNTYYEKGFQFYVVVPTPGIGGIKYDWLQVGGAGQIATGLPYNPTAGLTFQRFYSPDSYVAFCQTSGEAFGLSSVQLGTTWGITMNMGDLPVTFEGIKAGGVTVYQTFTVLGSDWQNWQTFYFDSDFSSGLLSVNILTKLLLMDNLQFIPEPSTTILVSFGLLAGWRMLRRRT